VTSWPRGLVDYTTTGPADATPEPEEDRTRNRLRLAARLLAVLRSQGHEAPDLLRELRSLEAALAAGRRDEAARGIEPLLERIDRAREAAASRVPPSREP
jgi:hypothetical protein